MAFINRDQELVKLKGRNGLKYLLVVVQISLFTQEHWQGSTSNQTQVHRFSISMTCSKFFCAISFSTLCLTTPDFDEDQTTLHDQIMPKHWLSENKCYRNS